MNILDKLTLLKYYILSFDDSFEPYNNLEIVFLKSTTKETEVEILVDFKTYLTNLIDKEINNNQTNEFIKMLIR